MAPIEIKAVRVGIQFNDDSQPYGLPDNGGDIDSIALARKQKTTGEMAYHGDIGIVHGPDDAGRHLRFGHIEPGVHGGHDKVHLTQEIVGIIQGTIGKDVHLTPLEDSETVERLIHTIDDSMLLAYPVGIETVRIASRL